ncbi:hypothetical protein [Actinoplanes derwentensis]|uniref:Uncharacterized protein n=1 Tax=Actinoplanes derwentensis TaxID=113562 RepID=A0A1H2D334_9ACTN|nr:hypothetical protein [Actinoplanes derwentensis]GID88306.1 hypothetical protein Ade03nite_72300 [Actinoplanes derwentensis]SDT77155.1 hypothetical protein SAMN04489716_7847 [Actinoplanes derwentensis]
MIRNAVMPVETAGTQIFVDSTGRRKRLLAVAGFLVALVAALYIAMVGASVVRVSDAALNIRASALPATSVNASSAAVNS